MTCRERRSWTEDEDDLLRNAVKQEDPDGNPPSKWHQISKHVPNRTNKDCRKRWFAKMASVVAKGGWSADEDERLIEAVQKYGTKWSLVAGIVQTRNNDQCAKRWSDTLNPDIDRTVWSPEEDAQLLDAVEVMGKSWTKIVKTYFPGRTGLSAKNRYSRLIRINSDPSKGARTRRRSVSNVPYARHRSPTSASSSSDNNSISPGIDPLFPCVADVPEFAPLMSLSPSTLDDLAFRRSLTTDTPGMISGDFVNSSASEYLNMGASSTVHPSPSRSSSSLDAFMTELSASSFDLPTNAPPPFRPNRPRMHPSHMSFSDSNVIYDPQHPWTPGSRPSVHTNTSYMPQTTSKQATNLAAATYPFPFPIDNFSAASSPSLSINTSSLPPTPSSLNGLLSPSPSNSPSTIRQHYVGPDDLMTMLQTCGDVPQYHHNPSGYYNKRMSQPSQSRNDPRRMLGHPHSMRDPHLQEPTTVHSFVNGLWGNMCSPTRLPGSPSS
ncbi:hypothetical protein ONZ45_g17325 [Pleurotus djamor]|nr:hypothetical protein ONZ45_g17325 [Pleurotus djamor]